MNVARPRVTTSASAARYAPSVADFWDSFYPVLNRWKSETALLSDPERITAHPSFRAIVENAGETLPLIIDELRKGPSLLVWALEDAFGERPYGPGDAGDICKMTEAWIAWAETNGGTL